MLVGTQNEIKLVNFFFFYSRLYRENLRPIVVLVNMDWAAELTPSSSSMGKVLPPHASSTTLDTTR